MAEIYEQQIDRIVESIKNAFPKIPLVSVMTNEPLPLMEQMIQDPSTLAYIKYLFFNQIQRYKWFTRSRLYYSFLYSILGETATIKCGNYFNVPILLLNHFLSTYEGYTPRESALLIYALKKLGIEV